MVLNFLLHFELPIKFLKIFGIWQTKESSRKYRLWGFITHLIFMELYFILPLVYLLKINIYDEEVINFMFLFLGVIFKNVNFVSRMKSIDNLFLELKDLLELTALKSDITRLEMQKHVKFMIYMFRIILGSIMFTALADLSRPVLENHLPNTMWIPYDYNHNQFVFWTTTTLQFMISIVACPIIASLELIPVLFMGMAAKLLAELSERMNKTSGSGKSDDEKYLELVKCIGIHLKIKDYAKNVENCFSITFFVQGFMSSTFICVNMFFLSTVTNFSNSFMIVFVTFIHRLFRYHRSTSF